MRQTVSSSGWEQSHGERAWWMGHVKIYESHSVWSDDPSWMTMGWRSQTAQMWNFRRMNLTLSDGVCPAEGTGCLCPLRALFVLLWGPCHMDWQLGVCLFVFLARLRTPAHHCIPRAKQSGPHDIGNCVWNEWFIEQLWWAKNCVHGFARTWSHSTLSLVPGESSYSCCYPWGLERSVLVQRGAGG